MKKVVVMGGSFNPPTIAHQKMLTYVVEQLGADKQKLNYVGVYMYNNNDVPI